MADTIRKLRDTVPRNKPRSAIGMAYNYLFYKKYKKKLSKSDKKLTKLKNKHSGRCYIIATGPSLGKTNFSKIKNEVLIGINDLYRLLDDLDISPQYWVDVSPDRTMATHILNTDTTAFFGGNMGRSYLKTPIKGTNNEPIILRNYKEVQVWKKINTDIQKGANGGKTVMDTVIQVALHLGFKEIGLIGCDCGGKHYKEKSAIDYNNYNGWEMNWKEVIESYKIIKDYMDKNLPDRKIINYTVGGNLEVFERRNLGE